MSNKYIFSLVCMACVEVSPGIRTKETFFVNVNTTQCTGCKCFSAEDEFDPCPEGDRIGDGGCNLSNNNTVCSYDGGDCSR